MIARLTVFMLLALPSVFSLEVLNPAAGDLPSGSTLDLGTIGPGQTFELLFEREVDSGGLHGIGGLYDSAYADELPTGWKSSPSKLYQDPLQVTVTAAPDAAPGEYEFDVYVIDEKDGEDLGTVRYRARVRITYDVLDLKVAPDQLTVGPGQPAKFVITVTNKGSTGDVFQVGASGIKRWAFQRSIYLSSGESKTISYPLVGEEEEAYKPTISAVSRASPLIHEERNVTLTVESGLLGDMKATNNGVPIFPVFEIPLYAIAGLLSNLF